MDTVTGNRAVTGGGLYVIGGGTDVTIVNCTIDNNTASAGGGNDGGALYNTGTLSLTNSTFSANRVTDQGGGIFQSSNATIKNSTFYDNTYDLIKSINNVLLR